MKLKHVLDVLSAAERPAAAFEDQWRAAVKRRVIVVVCVLAAWAAAVEGRFVYLQVVDHERLLTEADNRQQRTINDKAKRGEIVDRNGQILAYSVEADTIVSVPTSIKKPVETADALCRALNDCTPEFRAQLVKTFTSKKAFGYVRRQVTPEEAARVAALKLDGIGIRPETKRFYPKRELAAHLVGFVNTDSIGLGGVERAYNKYIRGVDGLSQVQVDAHQRTVQSRVERASIPGATVELTIDQYVQYIAERELAAGIEKFNAKGGSVVVMDPNTGEILAEANFPTFNPNFAGQADPDERTNRAIEHVYEPGSTFKIVTVSAAIEEGVFKPGELVDTNPGVLTIPGRKPITEAKGHNYGVLSFEDVLVHSSNIGAIKIGFKVGAERMERYIRRFGFGQISGNELAGETPGRVNSLTQLNESSLASMSMGYEVSVTPLQMAAAVSSVANGGTLYQPHVVRAVIQNGVRKVVAPKPIRRTINETTAAELTTIMERVVAEKIGTGNLAQIDGYQVAGKTGTAAKVVDGHYSKTDYNVSFAGFVPSRHPRLAILVMIDTPRNGSPYGGSVAAPIWKNIAEATLRQLGVPRTVNPIPPVLIRSAASAIDLPVVNAPVVPVVTEVGGAALVPDVRGLSAREALRVLSRAGLATRVSGSGVVAAQFPEAGAPLERGASIVLQLKRQGDSR
ncbi:MAG: PASTA domain-containing protein [Acidobacteria bacterium]|nr:MAG: PASTA domain-containing protein [Acidobacteriota bacterium]